MTGDEKDVLIEQAVSAYRERNASGRILPSATWFDLSEDERDVLFVRQLESRILESALDATGLSSTARAVLSRLR